LFGSASVRTAKQKKLHHVSHHQGRACSPPVPQNVDRSIPLESLWRHLPAGTRLAMAKSLGRLIGQQLSAARIGREAGDEKR
jgi:hypothetical protein